MRIYLATDRLVLRYLTMSDVDPLYELDSDPEVMRFLTNGQPTPLPIIRDEVLPRLLAEYERDKGYGRFAALRDGEFIGWIGLRPDGELGYRLHRRAWGQGYATEGTRALIHQAFTGLGAPRVYAQTMAVNRGSRRVMEKSGLRLVRTFFPQFEDPIPGTEFGEVEYALEAEAYHSGR